MSKLKTNPENGRKSGDIWSIEASEELEVSKGDFIFLNKNGKTETFKTKTEDSFFLGIADEAKEKKVKRNIIVLSRGVFPFNKTNEEIKIGDPLAAKSSNELKKIISDNCNMKKLCIAVAYKNAEKNDTIVYAKIITRF